MGKQTRIKISDCKDYILAILNGSIAQAKKKILSGTGRELRCLGSILTSTETLPLPFKATKLLTRKKNKAIIYTLGKYSNNPKKQIKILKVYNKEIVEILKAIKNRLLTVLRNT